MVEDVDGNVFLDCAAGIAVNSTGHSHPDVVTAITEQAQRFLHMSGTDFYYEPQVRLAEELAAIAPIDGGVRSFFGNSGTEGDRGVHQAGALRDRAAEHHRVSSAAFHGRTLGSLSLTASKAMQRRGFGPLMPGVFHAPYADCYRCPVGLTPDDVRRRVPRLHRAPAVRAPRLARRSGGDRRRADSGRRRLRRRARRSSSQRLRELTTQARHPAGRRRSAVGHGAHREDVRDRARRRGARHRSRSRRGSRRACRSASPWRAPTS